MPDPGEPRTHTRSRTQAERTAASQRALIDSARLLFGSEGYAAIGTGEIARRAGVSRGALYHQFDDKLELFAAVLDEVEAEIEQRMIAAVAGLPTASTVELLLAGADAVLDACTEADIRQIVLIDGPSVLGWGRWREICLRHSVGLVYGLLEDGVQRGVIAPAPVLALTHVLVGAVDEAALYVAQSADPVQARADVEIVLERLARSLVNTTN